MPKTVYVVGADGYKSNYINWTGLEQTDDFENADLIFLEGGADWSSSFYNQPDSGYLNCFESHDHYEMHYINKAIESGKKIWGTCRGFQILPCIGGLKGGIFQHVKHPWYHGNTTADGKTLVTNSLHHNLVDVSNLKEGIEYIPLMWSKPSPCHINGWKKNVPQTRDIEAAYFPKLGENGARAMGTQFHPEMMYNSAHYKDKETKKAIAQTIEWCQEKLNLFMEDKL
jgi:gamma-glutamyl-gamma-aminobutyrate hydrolase PuuD